MLPSQAHLPTSTRRTPTSSVSTSIPPLHQQLRAATNSPLLQQPFRVEVLMPVGIQQRRRRTSTPLRGRAAALARPAVPRTGGGLLGSYGRSRGSKPCVLSDPTNRGADGCPVNSGEEQECVRSRSSRRDSGCLEPPRSSDDIVVPDGALRSVRVLNLLDGALCSFEYQSYQPWQSHTQSRGILAWSLVWKSSKGRLSVAILRFSIISMMIRLGNPYVERRVRLQCTRDRARVRPRRV